MNPLEQYPGLRKILYLVQWVVNLSLGTIGVVMLILGKSPLWLVATNAAFNYLWTASGITASANVPPSSAALPDEG